MSLKKLKKTLTLGEVSAIEWKKKLSKMYSSLLLCIKPSYKSTFVQQTPKFEQKNKHSNELEDFGFCLVFHWVSEISLGKIKPYVNPNQKTPIIYLCISQIL